MMRRSVHLVLLVNGLLMWHHSSAFFGNYGHEINLPKCCNPGEAVNVTKPQNGTKINCDGTKESYWRTKYFVSNYTNSNNNHFFDSCSQFEECIDYGFTNNKLEQLIKYSCNGSFSSINETDVLPKCCDTNHSYDTQFGACRTDKEYIFEKQKSFFIQIGLPGCDTVVTDHALDSLDNVSLKRDRTIEWAGSEYSWGKYCFDKKYGSDKYILKVCEKDFSKCRNNTYEYGYQCIRKCCPVGETFLTNRQCGKNSTLEIQGYNFLNNSRVLLTDNVAFIHGLTCSKYVAMEHQFNFTLNEAGTIKLDLTSKTTFLPAIEERYCYERASSKNFGRAYNDFFFLCTENAPLSDIKLKIISCILCISIVCLLITFIGYLILPDMQNLHGRTLMVHCFCLMLAAAFLATAQFNPDIEPKAVCRTIGISIFFWFLAAFMWLTIMCFDIWWTFGSMRVQGIGQRQRELKRFLHYNIFGWSFPLFITVFAVCAQKYEFLPEKWTPDFGKYNCFFSIRDHFESYAIFFLMPVAVLILCNSVLFARTTYYCYKVKSEIAKIKDSSKSSKEKKKWFNADKERLMVIFKLFVIMGIAWIFEVISGFYFKQDSVVYKGFELIVDSYNASEGILIFCVFMLKKKVLQNFRKKFGIASVSKTSSQNTTNTSLHSSSERNLNLKNIRT